MKFPTRYRKFLPEERDKVEKKIEDFYASVKEECKKGKIILPFDGCSDYIVDHRFCGGVYIRQLFLEPHVIVVGRYHKRERHLIVLYGDCAIFNTNELCRVKGPIVMTLPPGRTVVYSFEPTELLVTLPTEHTTVEEVEAEHLEPEELFLEEIA